MVKMLNFMLCDFTTIKTNINLFFLLFPPIPVLMTISGFFSSYDLVSIINDKAFSRFFPP